MLSTLALLACFASQGTRPDLEETLTPRIQEFLEQNHLPGLAIGIVDGGQVVYARGFGETKRGSGKPITTKSIFHMASVSKPFTATAVMQLVEDGKLALEDTIAEHLPYFRLADEASKEITLFQVLTHTSGFPDVHDYEWDKPQHDAGAAERYVRSLGDHELLFAPGQGQRYSNMAFDTLGAVIAEAAGISFEDHVRTRILEPLGMNSSSFLLSATPPEHRTQGHSTAHSKRVAPGPCPVYPYNRRHAPSSTLNSNVEDMCRWMLANLARGELEGNRILRTESSDHMWSRDDDTPDVGLSWWVEDVYGKPVAIHTGSDTGYNSRCILFLEEGLGIVLMSNTEGARLVVVEGLAIQAMLGVDYEPALPRISIEIAHVIEEQGVAAAVEHYLELQENEPGLWRFGYEELDRVVELLLRKERYAEAVDLAALNADVYPHLAQAFTQLGRAQAGTGDKDAARASFEWALGLAPGDAVAREALADLDR